jgi:ketosteroid isomerase-like protein
MRNVRSLVGVLTLAAAAACSAPPPPPAQGTPDDEVTIRGLAGKYSAAFNANDVSAIVRMVSDDFERVAADGTHVRGRAAFQQMEEKGAQARQAAGLKLTLDAPTNYVRWIDATHAVAGGAWTMTGLPAGAPSKGSWMTVLKKSADSQWLITNSLVADFVEAPPAAEAKGKGK